MVGTRKNKNPLRADAVEVEVMMEGKKEAA